jgi:hypothetical protein
MLLGAAMIPVWAGLPLGVNFAAKDCARIAGEVSLGLGR